ncbi:hypothetical protein BJ170DRAFT_720165 [Xylariales sp. AK1849]|nr:hypothetical protein BJ170DRAFT_720165 [Xylariales sp. AK1849]
MRFTAAVLHLTATLSPALGNNVARQDPSGNYIEACPNPEYRDLNGDITCMNFTDPTIPKGYGGRTCISTTCISCHPDAASSPSSYGTLTHSVFSNRTEDCLPDTRENGFIIPAGGARSLPLPDTPGDPYAFDDETVAFNCKPL